MPKHLLILDDQKDLLMVIERELGRHPDWDVSAASTITEAFAALEKKPIELIIADVRIGEQSGFAFAKSLRRDRPDIALIFMSAYRSKTNHTEAEAVGAFRFLEKPFPMSKLITAVENYFTQAEMATRASETTVLEKIAPKPPMPSLTHFQAQDLVQLFCLNGRAIVISVNAGHASQKGSIYIQRGNVRHAEMGELTGDQAFYALLTLRNPELVVKDWDKPVLQSINTPWEHLLLKAAVQKDLEQIEGDSSPGLSAIN